MNRIDALHIWGPVLDDSWDSVPVRRLRANGHKAIATDPDPGSVELLFAAYMLASAAAWLAWTWWWRW